MLRFSTDKEKYNVGETAKIFFPSSEGGRALISIENGTKVLKTIWTKTKKTETLKAPNIGLANTPLIINIGVGYTFGGNGELGILCKQTDGQFGFLGRPQGKVLRVALL